jgi:hypothetical protein
MVGFCEVFEPTSSEASAAWERVMQDADEMSVMDDPLNGIIN